MSKIVNLDLKCVAGSMQDVLVHSAWQPCMTKPLSNPTDDGNEAPAMARYQDSMVPVKFAEEVASEVGDDATLVVPERSGYSSQIDEMGRSWEVIGFG